MRDCGGVFFDGCLVVRHRNFVPYQQKFGVYNFINKINMFKIEIINAKIDNFFAVRDVRDALMIFCFVRHRIRVRGLESQSPKIPHPIVSPYP